MDAFVTKRPRDASDDASVERLLKKAATAPAAKPTKPKAVEFVGSGAVPSRLDASTLTAALADLEKVDEPLKGLVAQAQARGTGAHLLVAPPSEHATFIFLCEFVVRRRIRVKAIDRATHSARISYALSAQSHTQCTHLS